MPINYKDINELTEQTTIAGTEKVPVSGTKYVLFNKIKAWIINSLKATGLDLGGKEVKNAAIEVVTTLPTANNNFVGRQVTYQGRSYIWDGGAWKCDAKLFNLIKGTDIASLDGWSQSGWSGEISTYTNEPRTYKLVSLTGWRSSIYQLPLYLIGKKLIVSFKAMRISSETTATASRWIALGNGNSWYTYPDYQTDYFNVEEYGNSSNLPDDTWVECTKSFILNDLAKFRIVINGSPSTEKTTWLIKDLYLIEETQENWNISLEDKADENQTINFDTNNIEPTQSGTVTKTSTWLWQYLTRSVNYSWLKLKTWVGGLFSAGSATTNNNYLPKIDDVNKKLVKSNIYDNGTNVGIGTTTLSEKLQVDGNVKANGYKVGSGTDTKLLTDGGGTKLITDFANSTHDHDADYLGILATAADSDKLDGKHASDFAGADHTHVYSLLANLPLIYNADHAEVPTGIDDFDALYDEPNDVWLCSHSMRNAPLDDNGGTDASYNTNFVHCIVQQFGKDTKIQVLYITTGDVANLYNGFGSIFYRIQGDNKWKRIATYSEIIDLRTQFNILTTTVNNKQDKRSVLTDINIPSNGSVNINPSANKVQYINLSGQVTYHTISLNHLNSLDEYTMVIINPNNAGRIIININSSYKFVGVVPSWSFNSWVICIWRGMIFANILN